MAEDEVIHRGKELVEVGRLIVIRVLWRVVRRLASVILHGCCVMAWQIPITPPEIVIYAQSVALSAGAEYKLCLTWRLHEQSRLVVS